MITPILTTQVPPTFLKGADGAPRSGTYVYSMAYTYVCAPYIHAVSCTEVYTTHSYSYIAYPVLSTHTRTCGCTDSYY